MKFSIFLPEKVSLNKIYAGVHFRQRMDHKTHYARAVMAAKVRKYTGTYPIAVHYHFKCSGPRLDISNHAYMQKMTEDALVARGVIPDDTPEYVCSITITAEQIKKSEANCVEVEFSPA